MNNFHISESDHLWDEIWSGCGEQLEHVDPRYWNSNLVKVLMRLLKKERELNLYYKGRLNENTKS